LQLVGLLVTTGILIACDGGSATTQPTPSATSLAGRTLTIATFGGTFMQADQANFGDPFSKRTGVTVKYMAAAPATTAQLIQQEQPGTSSGTCWRIRTLVRSCSRTAAISRSGRRTSWTS
jgi:spermidine/putrescine-binding protein